ncbi:Fc.00g099510.m01.CDS01 [Cosmosporella sp. VM-42]
MLRVTSSRRAAGLKPTDYDHEISLVDHDAARTPPEAMTPEPVDITRSSTMSRLLPPNREDQQRTSSPRLEDGQTEDEQDAPSEQDRENGEQVHPPMVRPSIEVQEPTPAPDTVNGNQNQVKPKKPRDERETAIDILYENERGGFLCGVALFSGAALGGLDPPPWTNQYHKASPTSIHTAQVPDPSWEWAWPEWRVNHQEGVDEAGWEYSFHFSKKFSWHSGKWWNSFVRRRAWTRKRIKKRPEDISSDPHMLNTDYFTVRPASEIHSHRSHGSIASSRIASRMSMSQMSGVETDEKLPDIENTETLMHILRAARIDREKLEAVENYLENATDLSQLQEEMHEIMSLFVFQASRRILLSRLMQIYDETTKQLEKKETPILKERKQSLKDAVKHADEEVRKLAYWSDVKQMAESGDIKDAVDTDKGWHEGWQGVDQSGGAQPNNGKLPGD